MYIRHAYIHVTLMRPRQRAVMNLGRILAALCFSPTMSVSRACTPATLTVLLASTTSSP